MNIYQIHLEEMRHKMNCHQEMAYYKVFVDIFQWDTSLNTGIKYIALDLSHTMLAEKEGLVKAIQGFCEHNGYTLLLDTFEHLKTTTYFNGLLFINGILITFKDKQLHESLLTTSAEKWRDGRGARGADYTVKCCKNIWEIYTIDNEWVS